MQIQKDSYKTAGGRAGGEGDILGWRSPRGHPKVNFKSQSESARSSVVTLGGGMDIPD